MLFALIFTVLALSRSVVTTLTHKHSCVQVAVVLRMTPLPRTPRWRIGRGEAPVCPAEIALQGSPVEARAGVLLAAWRNVLVADDLDDGHSTCDGCAEAGEADVLSRLEVPALQAFKLDADGMVVAVVAPAPARGTGVPGARVQGDELHQLAIAPNKKMRRHRQTANLLEVGVGVPVELVGKQLFDLWAAVLTRWQADGVDDDQVDQGAVRSWAKVGRGADPGTGQPAAGVAPALGLGIVVTLCRHRRAPGQMASRCPGAGFGSASGAGLGPAELPLRCG